jgi:phosphoglycolate phosphatase
MAMARRADCGALGVSWGYHPVEDLHAAGAHAVLDHAHQIGAAMTMLLERLRVGAG